MFRITVKPQWHLESRDGGQRLSRLVELLAATDEHGALAPACREVGLSYRYAWGLLQESATLFGAPLVNMARGRGAELTPLAEKLVWADKRIAARLSPLLDSLASELEVELERAVSAAQPILRLQASHGFAVETLRQWFTRQQIPLDLKYRTSFEAVAALHQHSCDMAGFPVPVGEFQAPVLRAYLAWLDAGSQRLIHLASRRQGLIVAPKNPLAVRALTDLTRPGVRFVNRQPGSSTRALLDLMLRHQRIDVARIQGYDSAEFTHAAVAAYVASGMAEVGLGVETAAQRFKLGFVPLCVEHYFFVCHTVLLRQPVMRRVLAALRSAEFHRAVSHLAGYDPRHCGEIRSLRAAFPEHAAMFRKR
ncbi:MAG: helix-turn-helix transcriptional regulator [Gammaproteobacteria bacterium]|nr:helix-turn-helix transcriptional regulator [Gammaproteobacteria bacterium]